MPKNKLAVDLMLDSGAFSAWNRNTTIDLKSYIAYVKECEHLLWSYVVLDVLPPGKESLRTAEANEEGARKSYRNLQIMKDAGLGPLPIFHQGERFQWLDKMLKDGETYIGVSTRKDLRAGDQRRWLDEVYSILTNKQGLPLIHTHGFGITNPRLLFRFPFYTVDSTTWSLTPGFGQILIPKYRAGKPDYLQLPTRVIVSGVQHRAQGANKKQTEGMGPNLQEHVRKFLEEEVGISVAEARCSSDYRRRAMLIYFKGLCNNLKDVRFTQSRRHPDIQFSKEPTLPFKLKLMYATNLSPNWSALMTEVGARTRLLSYFELKDKPIELLERYVTTGMPKPYERKHPKTAWHRESYLSHRRLGLINKMKEVEEWND